MAVSLKKPKCPNFVQNYSVSWYVSRDKYFIIGHATTTNLWFQSLFRYHWYKLSHNTLPGKRRRRAPNHGITLNPLFSLIFSHLTCSCWNEANLIWIGFSTVIFCTHSNKKNHSPQDLKQHSWLLLFWMPSKNIFKTRLRQRSSYDWVGPFSVRRNRGSWGPRPMRTPISDSSDSLRGVETSSTRGSQAAQVSLTIRGLYQKIASSLALGFDLCPGELDD